MDYPGKVIRKTPVTPTQASASGVWTVDDALQAVKTNTWPIAGVPNPISRSLRFNSADSTYLNRTFGSGDQQKFTLSLWVKRSESGARSIFTCGSSGSSYVQFRFNTADTLYLASENPSLNTLLETTQVFRDYSAWYHIVLSVDTTQATSTNRIKFYVNGSQITSFSSSTYPAQNTNLLVNSNIAHYLGTVSYSTVTNLYGGYMTEINFIDGQQLAASDFGLTDPQTGQWVPKKYTGTYGTNGFYVNFKDNSSTGTLGYDYSGNSNNWTANNFSVTAGAGNDSLVDVPTPWIAYNTSGDTGGVFRGNYATWNPLFVIPSNTTNTFANGNLEFTVTQAEGTGTATAASTMALPTTGKWYWEITPTTVATANAVRTEIGIMNPTQAKYLFANDAAATDCYAYAASGVKVSGSSQVAYGNSYTANDVIGVAVDLDNGAIYFAKNNTWQNSGVPTSGSSKTGAAYTSLTGSSNYLAAVGYWGTYVANFGQRPFAYTPPAGFLSLCTTNLPTPTTGATSTTQAGKYFNTVLYTGTGSSLGVTGVGFQPDFVWIKGRSGATDHGLYDAVRGVQKQWKSNSTDAETTETTGLTAFGTDGFTVGSLAQLNTNTATYASWNWKANGAGSSNTAGTITSTVSANATAGFSVVTYTGNGTSGATVGHGCLVNGVATAPRMMIFKQRSGTTSPPVYHASLTSANYALFLNLTIAEDGPNTAYFNNTAPSSTVFTLGNLAGINGNGNTFVAYCFAPVPGYSAFGSYTGNGSTDGPFIYTGFRPEWILIKPSSLVDVWQIEDAARSPFNVVNDQLFPNSSAAEQVDSATRNTDFLSNGFKIRGTNGGINQSSATYIYAAFAEFPFKFSNAR